MEVLKLTQKNMSSVLTWHIKNSAQGPMSYYIVESPIVLTYRKDQINEELCTQLGYEIYEIPSNNGTFVSNAGDIGLGWCCAIGELWYENFMYFFVDWLKKQGLAATIENNDILVDGHKVCGVSVTRHGQIDYHAAHIGINTNLDHIKQICTKPMVKVPKGLGEWGITTEEVEQMFLDFCEQENNRSK